MEEDDFIIDVSLNSSITIPSSPNIGDIWLDTSTMNTNVYVESGSWLAIDSNGIDLTFVKDVIFENSMPHLHDVEEMCKEYPALDKAFENFKLVYKMVEQDWIGKKKDESSN